MRPMARARQATGRRATMPRCVRAGAGAGSSERAASRTTPSFPIILRVCRRLLNLRDALTESLQ